MTNSIRRYGTASLLGDGEAWKASETLGLAWKAIFGSPRWLETERWEGSAREAGRPVRRGDGGQESEPS